MAYDGPPPASGTTSAASSADTAPMPLTIVPLRRSAARMITSWHYPDPYSIYDMDMRWPMVIQQFFLFLGGSIYYAAFRPGTGTGESAELVGFFSFVLRSAVLDVGIAMRPDLTGRGLGLSFVLAGLDFARKTFAPASFRLDVAVFNQRARRTYERAHFHVTRTVYRRIRGREYPCLEMIRNA